MTQLGEVLEIRVGLLRFHEEYRAEIVDGTRWPNEGHSGYSKKPVTGPVRTTLHGLEGDEAGLPVHVADSFNRGALVVHEDMYKYLLKHFPDSAETLKRGGLAENFVVNHPELLPSVVCVGDKFQIGSTFFHVSGARQACPKIDAIHNARGMTAMVVANGWAGYFLRVDKEGEVCAGDKIILLERPHPGWTIERISRGLWGSAEQVDNSREFLTYLSELEVLIPRHFRETAQMRLQRLNEEESKAVSPVKTVASSTKKEEISADDKKAKKTSETSQMTFLVGLLVALFAVFLYTQYVPRNS